MGRLISIILANTKSLGIRCSPLHTVFSIVGYKGALQIFLSKFFCTFLPILPSLRKHPLLFQGDKTMHSKTATFGIFCHFGPNIGLSGPFCAMPDQKSANEVPRWFPDMLVPKRSLPLEKLGCLAQGRLLLPLNKHLWPFLSDPSPIIGYACHSLTP